MTNEEWMKSLDTFDLATLLEGISSCNRCIRRGNNCFPMSMDDWLTAEHTGRTDKEAQNDSI